MTPLHRLELSEQVISGWEAAGWPSGSIPDNLRLIAEELAMLLTIAKAQPVLNERVDAVAYRYRLMEAKLKVGLN
jgi:hypothetical protein